MQEILSYSLFAIGKQNFTVGQIILISILIAAIVLIYRYVLKTYFPKFFQMTEISNEEKTRVGKTIRLLVLLCLALVFVLVLDLDRVLYANENFSLTILPIIRTLILFQCARIVFWVVSNAFIHSYYARRESADSVSKMRQDAESKLSAEKTVKYIFFLLVGIYMLQNFNMDPNFYERNIDGEQVSFKASNLLQFFLIIFLSKMLVWFVTQILLHNIYKTKDIVVGSQYAINQLVKYVIYVFAFIIALDVFGINMNILLGGAAALLVGIGLGLQQTFNDFVSGVVMLFERSVSVGDVLEIDGEIGTVKEIGLRASILETRSSVSLVVPNHKLVNEKVVNWNHDTDKVRFDISIGVAYGSDTEEVKKILLLSVKNNPYVIKYPAPFVRFLEFNNSSLDFKLYFFTRNFMVIEDIKSDIRLEIDRLFREYRISIPFPQTEVRILKDSDNT